MNVKFRTKGTVTQRCFAKNVPQLCYKFTGEHTR